MLFPGAGGYWWRLVHRDTLSAAFKRTATEDRPNVKFSNSPGKESSRRLPARLRPGRRVGRRRRRGAAEGEPLFVKLVENGRVVYVETFDEQADRADRTWEKYERIELSPSVTATMARFRSMRDRESGRHPGP